MERERKDIKNEFSFEEENSSFDLMKWIRLLLRHWYLFVIAVVAALFFAHMSSKSWVPRYNVVSRVLIGESGMARGMPRGMTFMQGFHPGDMFRGSQNQIRILRSISLSIAAVEKMGLDIDTYKRTRFQTINLHGQNPVIISHNLLSVAAYGMEFHFAPLTDYTFQISLVQQQRPFLGFLRNPFVVNQQVLTPLFEGRYGIPLESPFFTITIDKKDGITPHEFNFRFRTTESWAMEFNPRLNFSMVERSSEIIASLTGNTPQRDRDFLDALFIAFLEEDLHRKNDAANRTIDFIDSQLQVLSDSLNVAENNLRRFRAQNKIFDISQYASALMARFNALEQREMELERRRTYLDYLSGHLKGNIEEGNIIAPSGFGVEIPALTSLVREYAELQIRREGIGEGNPHYRRVQTQIENTRLSMFEVISNMYFDIDIDVALLQSRREELMVEINALPEVESQMLDYQRRYRIVSERYTSLRQQRQDAEIRRASNSSDNIILDSARVQGVVNSGESAQRYTSNLLIGLIIPFVLVVLREFLNTTIRDKNDIKKITKTPIIASIQNVKVNGNLLLANKNPKSLFAEGFRAVNTRLEFITKQDIGEKKGYLSTCILATSSESGEGKSFFSINMAGVYAADNNKTILVDLDLRKPSIGKMLSLDQKNGITNYLIDQVELDEILIKGKYPFDVLLAGTVPPNPAGLIKTKKLRELLQILKGQYDYIVIDTSPIGLVGDAYALTKLTDANLFIVREQKTNKTFFKNAMNQLKEDNIQNVFIILNATEQRYSEYGNYMQKIDTSEGSKGYLA